MPSPSVPTHDLHYVALSIDDLVIRYGATTAVNHLSLSATRGQVTALVGPNGAGKTSTVEACVGLRAVQSGRIDLGGTPRSRIGVMLQDGGLYPTARPLDLARHVASLYPSPEDPAALLEALGIDPATRTTIRRLSGGEQQRVKCALALVGGPELVFLDEPTAGLDSAGRRVVHDLIRRLAERGSTIVLTTHVMDDVERLADHVVVVVAGRDVRSGTVASLVGDEDTIVFRGPVNADLTTLRGVLAPGCVIEEESPGRYRASAAADPMILSAIAAWCAQHGVRTSDLSVGRRSLEDVVHDLVAEHS